MKKLLIICCFTFPVTVCAQKMTNRMNDNAPVKAKLLVSAQRENAPKTVTPLAPGTYVMRPDNMPCVVPDMAKVEDMPNAITPNTKIPEMPNVLKLRGDTTGKKNVP